MQTVKLYQKDYSRAYGPRANYRQIGGPEGFLANRVPFAGNSMSARVDSNGCYIVMSYATVIAIRTASGTVMVADNRWGVTTGRHINLCRAWL